MYIFPNYGEIEMSERVPGRVTFNWTAKEIKRQDRHGRYEWKSPSFWFRDGSSVKHEWNLTLADEIVVRCCQRTENSLSIEYLSEFKGEADIDIVENAITLNQHDIFLKNEYELLFENGQFSDVTIVIEKQELHLHKSILSIRSPVFAAMFINNFKENLTNIVWIEDQTYDVMKEFFRYLYVAKVNNIDDHALEFFILSNKHTVDGLKILSEQNLMKTLQNETVLERLDFASLHDAKNLRDKYVKFIASNAREIVKLPDFDINNIPEDLRNEVFKLVASKS
ncbi:hypothetical protein QAD02_004931 [Eretmocerus hayati]|uniref:Uncharacterized protein n=1 Tax=Eretmocerus hayati TaxID=131215 RepID=A0ACC2NTP8_9HYME|nr:hypothetical protein QAD02_004931 [Eretmocerus hayati]